MDPVPPDSKRPRIAAHGAPLPHLQTSSQLPPPIPHQQHPQHLHHQPALPPPSHSSSYPSYPPRAIEPTSAQPALAGPPQPRHDADRRHRDREPNAPMQNHYRQQPPPSPAHGPYQQHPPYPPPRDGIVKREAPYDEHSRRSSSTGHVLEGAPAVQPVPTHQHHNQLPPYADSQTRHMNYDHGPPSVPPTPGGYRTSAYPPPTPIGQ